MVASSESEQRAPRPRSPVPLDAGRGHSCPSVPRPPPTRSPGPLRPLPLLPPGAGRSARGRPSPSRRGGRWRRGPCAQAAAVAHSTALPPTPGLLSGSFTGSSSRTVTSLTRAPPGAVLLQERPGSAPLGSRPWTVVHGARVITSRASQRRLLIHVRRSALRGILCHCAGPSSSLMLSGGRAVFFLAL